MSLRTPLAAASVCVGLVLSGCSGDQDKKPEPKRNKTALLKEKADPKPKPVTKADPTPPKGTTPKAKTSEEKTPEPKRPRELSKATIEAWEAHGFTAGWRGTNSAGQVVFQADEKSLRDAIPAFKGSKSTVDASLKGLPAPELPFALILSESESQVTDAGLEPLAGFTNLSYLDLNFSKVKGPGLAGLAVLPNLTSLSMRSTDVTDAGLKHLAGLKRLTSLGLGNTNVTDAGLKSLAGLQHLASLDLGGDEVTDAGLKQLAGLKNLASLNVFSTKVTAAGLKEIQQALPKCVITK